MIFFNLFTHTIYLQVEKSRTRIVDFDSSSDEEKEDDDDKRNNSEWREEVKTCLIKYISNSNWWQIWQNILPRQVDDLQQTLNSLGLEEDRRQVERKQSAHKLKI